MMTRRRSSLHLPIALLGAIALLASALWLAFPSAPQVALGAQATPAESDDAEATPLCPRLTDPEATPVIPAEVGTPAVPVICSETGLATPLTIAGYQITLTAAQDDAGPVDLTIELRNARGEPIVDATVVVLSQHLEMSHGVSVDEAFHSGDGTYQVNDVSLGMGGDWQIEIQIERPNQAVVAGVFTIRLNGPS